MSRLHRLLSRVGTGLASMTEARPRIVIIAELRTVQCTKYRVHQKVELLRRLGVDSHVADWRDAKACRAALRRGTVAIFYRVPGEPDALRLIDAARRLGHPPLYELDDLVFDEAALRANRNVDRLPDELRRGVFADARPARVALLACDGAIASTATLAECMHAAGTRETFVIENGLDAETLALGERLSQRGARPEAGGVIILYGSGTKTHDVDFECAAAALHALMLARPAVRLRIVGDLGLPAPLAALGGRVERLPMMDFAAYMGAVAGCDINLAPLEATLFNEAKSSIKFLEAAILAIPSICSPRAEFRRAIEPGVTGLLADDRDSWLAALTLLVDDPAARRRMGLAARAAALARWHPQRIAEQQVAPLLERLGIAAQASP